MTAAELSRRGNEQSESQQKAPKGYGYRIPRSEWQRCTTDGHVKNETGNPVRSARIVMISHRTAYRARGVYADSLALNAVLAYNPRHANCHGVDSINGDVVTPDGFFIA